MEAVGLMALDDDPGRTVKLVSYHLKQNQTRQDRKRKCMEAGTERVVSRLQK